MHSRVQNLDALRGLAAITVLAQHILGHVWRAMPEDTGWLKAIGLDYFDWGRFGVVLFFLISGFVIPYSFSGPTPLRKFVVSRLFRLYPAFWLSVIGMVAVISLAGGTTSGRQVLANLTMAYPAFREPALSGVYWTLIIELVFYCASAALFIVGALNRPLPIFVLALVAIASAVVPMSGNWLAGTSLPVSLIGYHLSFLLLGSLIRQSVQGIASARQFAVALGIILLLTLPLVTGMITGQAVNYSDATPFGAILSVVAALAVFLFSFGPNFGTPGRFALALGAWSYSIYLFHEVVAGFVSMVFEPTTPVLAIAYLAVVWTVTIAVAGLVYRFVEAPAIALGRHLVSGASRSNVAV